MKRLFMAKVFCLLSFIILTSSNAEALGLGLYGTYGSGSETWEYRDISGKFNYDSSSKGFGLVLDSNVAQNNIFNYQLNIGYTQKEGQSDLPALTGGSMSHDFGFGLVRTKDLRLWVGPEIKIAFYSGSKSSMKYYKYNYGIGPVVGLNVHLGKVVTLALKGGYMFNFGIGIIDYQDDKKENSGFISNGREPFITFAIIFRINDNFTKVEPQK